MTVTTVVETTKNPVIGQRGVLTSWGTPAILWLDSSALSDTANDQIEETKVTGGQYWEGTLEGSLDFGSKQRILEMIHMRNRQMPTLFALCGITFFAIAGYFLFQSVFDLGIASLGPGVTAVLAAIFSKMAGGTKK